MKTEKTALVLSAGGMFGAYQAGAYEIIADRIQIDMVVGASVGALNGWPIAAGCSPQSLTARWSNPDTGNSLRLVQDPGLRNGWFDPAPLQQLTEDLFAAYTPKIPFALVTLQLPWFTTRIIQHPNIQPAHLQASASIPYFLPAVEIEGKKYLDGGVFQKLPVHAAVKLGATRIIAIDCLPDLGPALVRAVVGLGCFFRKELPSGVKMTLIEPSKPMGTAQDAVFWKEENIHRWLEMGRDDAARAL